MSRIGSGALLATLVAFVSFVSFASFVVGGAARAEEPDFGRVGPYVGGHFVYAWEDFKKSSDTSVDDAVGFDLAAGWRVDPRIALELQWEFVPRFQTAINHTSENGNVMTSVLSLNGRFYPFVGRIQPWVMGGIGYMVVDSGDEPYKGDDGDAAAVRAGGGVDFCIDEHVTLGLGAEYVVPATDVHDFRYLSINAGVRYRF